MSIVPTFGLCLSLLTDITVGGARPVTVHVPPSYDPEVPTPVVILLHGWGGDGNNQESYWSVRPLSDAWGFLYAHPDGIRDPGGARFWNATDACCYTSGARPDDSSYLRSDPVALLNHLFLGAPAPPQPFPECGADGTADGLGCETPGSCE